ncbi:MAG: WecB/TagA/CpsF family glycosyltransferase [Patescibacteria group bacterium]|jgi:N-acetylglucosaminyldiphosphoundecaprenol N-acetyl-beta-D-mannosaminyltransferase
MSKILDVKIDELNFNQVMAKITSFLKTKELSQIVTVNPEFVLAAQKDKEFKSILNKSDLSVPDGFGLKIGAWILGKQIGERLTGVDLTWELAKLASQKGYSIYLLGAASGIAEKTAKRLKLLYPALKITGTYAGTPEEKGIIEKINNSKADILLVAFGAPKQDKFIYHNRTKLKVKLAMGVGGTFDYISETVPRAPLFLRQIGLEWLYRLVKQPKRAGRIFRAVIVFPLTVLISRF